MFSLGYIQQVNALHASPGSEWREEVFYYSQIDQYYFTADLAEHWRTAPLDDDSYLLFTADPDYGSTAFSLAWYRKDVTITLPEFYDLETVESIADEIRQLAQKITEHTALEAVFCLEFSLLYGATIHFTQLGKLL